MCKFVNLIKKSGTIDSPILHYVPLIEKCWLKYSKYIQDDFSFLTNETSIRNFILRNPFFWVILDYEEHFMGFVFLDNFIGSKNKLYSAEITTCFDKKAWGNFTRYSAKFFLKMCFDTLGLYKIKAQIYPDNFRVKKFLKDCGFVYESTLKNETLRTGKLQDIEIFALYKSYYYKNSRWL